ncbi:MAG: phosphate transport system substrate-binding protein [Alphaproteobacteria bacterium]|nr:MAG: phosphate transport system substrate-binding protein [Caulobacteraceae bacterium]TPW08747.1 MAG: phosphate transport system substrate-binding protein [Alphaproteobacteria bacterium]
MFHFRNKTLMASARALAAAVAISAVGVVSAAAGEITGAGATFPAPIYTKWAEQYAATGGDSLNYQAIGSGAGVTQIINRTVDFGASDTAVAPERLASQNLLQFPAVIGGVVIAVNIPGVDGNALKLTGPIIADIYLGRVRMWNDRRITAINPGVSLPALAIAPAYRADSSGTTNIFTSYIASISLPFQSQVGAGNSVAWRAGIGAPGNAGVAGAIRNTRGGFGYVEYAYATENRMQTPMIQNRSGQFVRPSTAAFSAAAAQANWANAPNLAVSMNNTVGATNWPIVGPTYIMIPKNPADGDRAAAVLKFFDWAFRNGSPAADQLHYVMLPESVRTQVRARWAQVKSGGRPVYTPAR